MTSIDYPTPEHIKSWVNAQRGNAQVWNEWDDKIWSKSYDDIVDYIYNKFCTTLDTVEYYCCMPFLADDMDLEILFTPFRQSPQYLRLVNGQLQATTIVKDPLLQKKKWNVPSKFKKFGR